MAVRANRYNDPALGAAFENIASIFAPPSAGETAAYANAALNKSKMDQLTWLFSNPNDPTASARSSLTGVQGYGQTPAGFMQTDSTNRRGQDITADVSRYGTDVGAQTSRLNNMADNQRASVTSLFGALNEGQVRPELPAQVAGLVGLPALPAVAGAPKPLSETEWRARENARLQQSGVLTDEILIDSIVGDKTPVQAVGADGKPMFMSPGAAVAVGAQPFVNRGAEAAKKPVTLVDPATNQRVQGSYDPAAGQYLLADGTPAPANMVPYNLGSPTGSNTELGIGKTPTNNIDQQLIDISIAQGTATKLRELISAAPASQGMVGLLRGTAQNLLQTSGEVGQYFGGMAAEANAAIKNGVIDASLAGRFDETLPAIEFLSNLLAFQHAKTTTGERLSNEMLSQSRKALGLDGWTSNQADSLARLNAAIEQMGSQADTLKRIRGEGTGNVGTAPPAPAAVPISASPSAPASSTPTAPSGRMRFDADGNPVP